MHKFSFSREAFQPPAVEARNVVETMQRRGRLAEFAYEYTKGLLFEGAFRPGQKVRVEEMVGRLHTSRQPVMDAFKRLASEGFLEIIPQVGCRVVVPDPAEVADFFLIFGAIEGLAAELAATRRTASELAQLEEVAARVEVLASSGLDAAEMARSFRSLDRSLHEIVHRMARSQSVANVAAGMWDRCDFYLASAANGDFDAVRRIRESIGEHAAVIAAITAGDAEAAREHMEKHVLAFGRAAGLYRGAEPAFSP
jgi:DNA-binding GntR family transcriptional regulator